jgi:adenosylcobinamide kinase/adenosylcobinamide-phosphate guanylyltransferase
MGKHLTFILGGARSGKSTYALELARERLALSAAAGSSAVPYPVTFVATAVAFDAEMKERIKAHRLERPPDWVTLEAPTQVGAAIRACPVKTGLLILDCLTLLANNVMLTLPDPENAPAGLAQELLDVEIDGLLEAYQESAAEWLVISNEVGLGLVPPYPLGRVYRDVLGRVNQRMARAADRVVFMLSGLPMTVK